MAIPKAVARFDNHVTNRVSRPLACNLPGFAVVTHVGRRKLRGAHARKHAPAVRASHLHRPERRLVSAPVRVVLRMLDVNDFLSMRPAPVQ